MKRITIKHFGNIQEATLDLKKFNVFIGPQSSGKSTIAKVISFCYWVEEQHFSIREEFTLTGEEFWRKLGEYYNMKGYQTDDSYIQYESDLLVFTCSSREEYSCSYKDGTTTDYMHTKVVYVPSERNVVALPGLQDMSFNCNYFHDFLSHWYHARKQYDSNEAVAMLDLNRSYYVRESEDGSEDCIIDAGGQSHDISLANASSGLRSLVPLMVMVDYYSKDISTKQLFTRFVIEEPEQNLFPTTQKELVYHLLRLLNGTQDGCGFTVTTHSPYILATFSLLLFATKAASKSNVVKEQVEKILPDLSLSTEEFGAYYLDVKDGKVVLVNLIDDKTGMISQNELDTVSEEIAMDFNRIYSMYAKSKRGREG